VRRVGRTLGATGGAFSLQYDVVREDGAEAFLKALNFQSAFAVAGSLVDAMAAFVSAYKFERDLLEECSKRKMSRVIRLLDHGEVQVPEAGLLERVPYLVLEHADGDLNAFQATLGHIDLAWVLRTLKHVALGIEQLHAAQTTHQDLKPSNVLTLDAGREMKLGDLGRAERKGLSGPNSENQILGAFAYAPPEQLYGAFGFTWEERRAGDLYLLGSLGVQLILGNCVTALIQISLPPAMRATTWGGDYASVLPYLNCAHADVMQRFRDRVNTLTETTQISTELTSAIADMTLPDPSLRGHPLDRRYGASPYSVRRYVSLFNKLTAEAEYRLRRI